MTEENKSETDEKVKSIKKPVSKKASSNEKKRMNF